MKTHWLKLLLISSPICLGIPSVTGEIFLDKVIAVVENSIIMESELKAKLREVTRQMLQQEIKLPNDDILEQQVLERMILTKIQLQLAEQTGIRVDDETLNQTINNIAKKNAMNLSEFRNELDKNGFGYEQFRREIRNEIIISRLRQRQVDNRVSITEKEIDNALMNKESQGNSETEYQLQHILISTPGAASQEEKEKARLTAEKVLLDLKEGANFSATATAVSDGQKALEGGYLDWRKKNELPTLFSSQIATMAKDDISDLIESSSGFHIVKLADIRNSEKHMITQTKVRHILIRPNELTSDDDAKERLERLKGRIENGDDFMKLARSNSDDMISAANGGSLDWVAPGELLPEFENAMNQLDINEISIPVRTQFGWHLIQVMERRDYDDTENNRRRKVADAIRRKKSEETHQNWLRHIRDEAYVEYR